MVPHNFRFVYRLSCINSLYYRCWTTALLVFKTESSKSSRKYHFIMFFLQMRFGLCHVERTWRQKVFKIPANCFLFYSELKKVLSLSTWPITLAVVSGVIYSQTTRVFCLDGFFAWIRIICNETCVCTCENLAAYLLVVNYLLIIY